MQCCPLISSLVFEKVCTPHSSLTHEYRQFGLITSLYRILRAEKLLVLLTGLIESLLGKNAQTVNKTCSLSLSLFLLSFMCSMHTYKQNKDEKCIMLKRWVDSLHVSIFVGVLCAPSFNAHSIVPSFFDHLNIFRYCYCYC